MSEGLNSYFRKGAEVEISSNDEGFRGAWYAGTVVGLSRSKNNCNSHLILVEYKTLMADESGSKPLRETLDVVQLRPLPPCEKRARDFKFSEEVDAYYNDGWWEGVITSVHPGNRYSVFFRATREQLELGQSELRLHREWVHGKWVPPVEEQQGEVSISKELKLCTRKQMENYDKGTLVEVSSDEDGFQGAWFAATVMEQLSNGNVLVEYKCLRNDDDTEFLVEVVDSQHIRPYPPKTKPVGGCFRQLEEVDALYNDGWWVGVISKVVSTQKYQVYFRGTNEEMEFEQSDLRPHVDWIGGKWASASTVVCNSMHW